MAYAAIAAMTPGVSAQVLALTFRELGAMLGAGLPLDQALDSAGVMGPAHFNRALRDLSHGVSSGTPLSEGMRAYRTLFHPIVPAIIGAAEHTGRLDTAFGLLAEFFETEAALKRTLQSALLYPTIVVITAILAVGILAWIGFMKDTWAVRLLWGLAAVAGLWFVMRFRLAQRAARYFAMVLPFFGGLIQQLAVARFCYSFGTLCRAGVPYLEGLQATQPVIEHPLVERAAHFIYAGVRNGNTVEESISAQYAFPPIVRNLVGAGEVAGSLDTSLLKAAEFLRNDAEYKIRNSAKLAGPLLIIGVGIIVALILVGFLQSYIDMIFSVLDE